jgi:hypothetical protein
MLKISISPFGPFADRKDLLHRLRRCDGIHADFELGVFFAKKLQLKPFLSGVLPPKAVEQRKRGVFGRLLNGFIF